MTRSLDLLLVTTPLTITTGGTDAYLESLDSESADFAAVASLANDAFAIGEDIYVSVDAFGSGDTYVFVDANADGLFDDNAGDDYVILLTGIEYASGD